MKNHVQFDNEFFKKTILEYQDWVFAFFRETAQNSCDAKATTLNYTFEKKDGGTLVTCDDNGYGMNRDVLLNKFLVMGGSHKTDESSVGGFGYAKSIILFCHSSYKIHTQNLLVEGSYGQYNDPIETKKRKGTKLSVFIENDLATEDSLEYALIKWVSNSTLENTIVKLNNKRLKQASKDLAYEQDSKIGKIKFNESNSNYYSTLWIRMRGMAMFKSNIYTNSEHFNGYLDLDSENSTECLTSNRDGLKSKYNNGLNSLIHKLSNEMTSLKMDQMDEFELNSVSESELSIEVVNSSLQCEKVVHKTNREIREEREVQEVLSQKNVLNVFKEKSDEKENWTPKIDDFINSIENFKYPDSFLVKIDGLKDKSNKDVVKAYKFASKKLNQVNIQKASVYWGKLVYGLLDVFAKKDMYLEKKNNLFYYNEKPINIGFILSERTHTMGMMSESNGVITILLNPFKIKEMKLSKYDLKNIAVHEIAHVLYPQHCDNHSYYYFQLDKSVNDSKFNYNKL